MQTIEHKNNGPLTPWGKSQLESTIAPGIKFHSTASHGGFHLDEKRQRTLMKRIPLFAPLAGEPWYEEDCDAHAVVLCFPTSFTPQQVKDSENFVRLLNERQTIFPNNWTELSRWIETESFEYLKENADPILMK